MSRREALIENMRAVELAKYARIEANLERAYEQGRISEHDRDERIARAAHLTAQTIAHFAGEPKPAPRVQQPLDDPDAGKVG